MDYLNHRGISFRYLNEGEERELHEIEFILHRRHKEIDGELLSSRIAVCKQLDAYQLVNLWNSPITNINFVWHYWIERV